MDREGEPAFAKASAGRPAQWRCTMNRKPKLELTWIGKDVRPRLEPRILLEDPAQSYHAAHRVKNWPQENAKHTKDSDALRSLRSFAAKTPSEVGDLFDNRLIFGDNLLALKALEQEFAGRIKCIFIDPPYYRLAPSLLEKDTWGNWVISQEFNAAMLAEAICKIEGFTYTPSDAVYWQHGRSTERDFLYVTTANLSHDQLQQLSDDVGPDRSLLVVCSAFRGRKEGYPNLTVKKIPKAVLTRCEWGHDDYSLKVENLPKAPPQSGQQSLFSEEGGA